MTGLLTFWKLLEIAIGLFSLVALFSVAHGEHGSPRLTITPQAKTLPSNEQIALLSFNGCHSKIDPEFLQGAEPKLVSAEDQVPLKLVHHFCDGDGYGYGVAILAPSKLLSPGKGYHFELLEAPPWDRPKAKRQTLRLQSWRATSPAALGALKWHGAPYLDSTQTPATIIVPVEEQRRPLHLLVEAKPLAGGGPTRQLTVSVWHEYRFDDRGCMLLYVVGKSKEIYREFDLSFTALNSLGERLKAPGQGLRFSAFAKDEPSLSIEESGAWELRICVESPKRARQLHKLQ